MRLPHLAQHTEPPDKGCRRIKDDLAHNHNLNVNEKRVLRICRSLDVKSNIKVQEQRLHQTGRRKCRKLKSTTTALVSSGRRQPKKWKNTLRSTSAESLS